jgi:hypothetical protein
VVWARVNLNSEAVLLHVVQYLNACERLNYSNERYVRSWRGYQVYVAASPQITLAWIFQHRSYDSTRKSNLECILNVRGRFFAFRSHLNNSTHLRDWDSTHSWELPFLPDAKLVPCSWSSIIGISGRVVTKLQALKRRFVSCIQRSHWCPDREL